jgi:hypothetical protein
MIAGGKRLRLALLALMALPRASLRKLAPGSTSAEPLETFDSPQPIVPGALYDHDIAVAPTA